MNSISVVLLSLISMSSLAAENEVFECKYPGSSWDDASVYAFSGIPGGSGTVAAAGVSHKSYYTVEGFIRVWRFGLNDNDMYYTFSISPNGDATYYGVTNETKIVERISFKCRHIENTGSEEAKPWTKYQK